MPPGRPPLRIGQHGKITRKDLGGGVWLARCRFRDDDGVVRIVERRTPPGRRDQYGKLAEDALVEHLEFRRTPSEDEVTPATTVVALVRTYLTRLEEEGRAAATIDTYKFAARKLELKLGGIRIGEATARRVDTAIRAMSKAHGPTMARQAKTILRGALSLAVLAGALDTNPVRDVAPIKSKNPPAGARALTAEELRRLLVALHESEYCKANDLVNPITLLIATGLRRSELLALRWEDVDEDAGTVTVTGKVVRAKGVGLLRVDAAKSAAGLRTVPLPLFALEMLKRRADQPQQGTLGVIFPSTAGTLRDPNNFGKQWRKVRAELGVEDTTTHSFRKSVATLIDEEGLSPRVGADQLGHRHVSMTMDRYMSRGKTHTEVAQMLDRIVAVNDE
ncbi:tyrosine-type recombinase/integrase [Rhodococcus pyridinivorans]|uniref:tyrosine-type recombinase/integrase n=1 Tax=Rhodococcus pyridinivorans TaxID=103816 RepID=UPI001908B748|nr:site-specific integrase [Rhodococcus pyridinivorans]QQM51717.1 site-specific integrase [Rhodococcus pyridinivorans]WAL44885.1 site-specific integrase [Rhodococcus pyridinivorans]